MPHGSLSQFKATLARKQSRDNKRTNIFEKKGDIYKESNTKTDYNFPKLSDAELEKVKEKIRRKMKSDRIKLLAIRIIITILTIVTCLFFYNLFE